MNQDFVLYFDKNKEKRKQIKINKNKMYKNVKRKYQAKRKKITEENA